jgi:Fic family protein
MSKEALAKHIGMSRKSLYNYADKDRAFKKLVDMAQQQLEQEQEQDKVKYWLRLAKECQGENKFFTTKDYSLAIDQGVDTAKKVLRLLDKRGLVKSEKVGSGYVWGVLCTS